MTEPTDSEILDAADDFRSQYMHGGITFDEFDSIGFARAVLAKWGTLATKTNQCGEVCERAKLCAICARGLEGTPPAVAGEPAAETLADEALIQQLVEALEAMQSEAAARSCGLRICDEAISLGRARHQARRSAC